MKRVKKAATAVLGGQAKLLHKNANEYSGDCSQLFCKEVNDAFLNPCLLSQCKITVELITIPCRKLVSTSCINEYFYHHLSIFTKCRPLLGFKRDRNKILLLQHKVIKRRTFQEHHLHLCRTRKPEKYAICFRRTQNHVWRQVL